MDEEDPCSIGKKNSGLFPFVQIAMRVVVVLIPVVFSLLRRLSFRGEATFRTKTDVKKIVIDIVLSRKPTFGFKIACLLVYS